MAAGTVGLKVQAPSKSSQEDRGDVESDGGEGGKGGAGIGETTFKEQRKGLEQAQRAKKTPCPTNRGAEFLDPWVAVSSVLQ